MATFTFGRDIDIHWNGYEIQGTAGTVFSIPDQLYEEFDADIAPVEPTLVWVDTNEFQTLTNNVSASTLSASLPIALTTTTSGKTISLSSSTNPNGYLLAADGTGGVIFTPASTSGLTSVVGVSPISTAIAGGTVSVSLTGNYVNAVIGTSPASVATASGTSTVSIDQAAITGATAATNAQVVRFLVKNTTGTTIPKGSAVYVSGATGDNALISLASATSDPSSSKTLGITAEAIANDAFGYVIEAGYLTDIDTSATTAGAAVWLGNTPGSLVFVSPPAEPSHAVYLGVVVRVQAINGSILVKVQNGYELDELHDVFVGGVSTALPLVYNSTSSGWVAQALTSVGIANNAIVAAKIAAAAVGSAALATGSVTSGAIASSAVTSGHIAAGAVGSAAIASGSINSTHIGANAVVAGDIAANAVTSGNIAAGAVGSAALADNAVVAAKINAAAVNTAKIDSTGGSNGWVLTANGSGGVTFAAASGASNIISFSTYTTASTLALTDLDKIVQANSTVAFTITVPPNSSVAFSTGSQVHVLQTGTGQLTIGAGSGVTVNSALGLKMRAQWSSGTLIKRDTNTWILVGDTVA